MNKKSNQFTVQTLRVANPVYGATSLQNAAAEPYTAPDIEIVNIELQQNFFGSGDLDDMDGSDW